MNDPNKALLGRIQRLEVGGSARARDIHYQKTDLERSELDRENLQRFLFDVGARGTRCVPTFRCDDEGLTTDSQIGFRLFGPHNGSSVLFRSAKDTREILGVRLHCLCQLCVEHVCGHLVGPFNVDLLAQGVGEISFTRSGKKINVSAPRQTPLLLEASVERRGEDAAAMSAMKQEIFELRQEVKQLSTSLKKLRGDPNVRRDRSGRILSLGELASMTAQQNAEAAARPHLERLRDLG